MMRMISWIFLLVLLTSDELVPGAPSAVAARIPEHTCHKIIGGGGNYKSSCNLGRCRWECSKEPAGSGECRGRICFCSFFCRDPPLLSPYRPL